MLFHEATLIVSLRLLPGGQRNWVQVLCNGGVAAYLGVIYFIESGSGEHPIDFHAHYRQSWLSIAILCIHFFTLHLITIRFVIQFSEFPGAISCANGDTWASELGTVMTSATPRLITSWKRVPRGKLK